MLTDKSRETVLLSLTAVFSILDITMACKKKKIAAHVARLSRKCFSKVWLPPQIELTLDYNTVV